MLARIRERFPDWAPRLGEDHLLDLKVLGQVGDTAMTSDRAIEMQANGLPNTFVPGRNLLFLTLAAALGYRRQLDVLVGGMCETDFSGYPDCRDDTIKAQQVALGLGLGARVTIETPLMWIDKSETWALARKLGGDALVDIVVEESHTCYLGERGERLRLGLRLRRVPGLQAAQGGLGQVGRGRPSGRLTPGRVAVCAPARSMAFGVSGGDEAVQPPCLARPMKRQRRIAAQARMAAASPVDRPIAPRAP